MEIPFEQEGKFILAYTDFEELQYGKLEEAVMAGPRRDRALDP